MKNCMPVNTPMECGTKLSKFDDGADVDSTYYRSLIGSLRYLTCTRPGIMYSVGIVSQYMENPKSSHLKATKRILRYIKGIISHGLHYYYFGTPRDLYFTCAILLSRDHQRSNQMLLCRHVKLNM